MTEIQTEIEPPGLDGDQGDGGTPTIALFTSLHELDGTMRSTATYLPGDATDAAIADALVRLLPAIAALRGPGLTREMAQRLRGGQ